MSRANALGARTVALHPLVRVGIFLVGTGLASVVLEGLVYPIVVWGLSLAGIHTPLHAWIGIAAVMAGARIAVTYGDVPNVSSVTQSALSAPAWRAIPIATAAVGGMLTIGGSIAALMALQTMHIATMPAGAIGAAIVHVVVALAPAAMFEELLVRGYALTVLAEWMGWRTAIGVTSVAFAGLHLLNPGVTVLSLLVVALAGVVLGLVRWQTQSLPAAWAAHFGWNFALVGLAHATVSGQAFATPSYRLVDDGPSWLTGGTWGPEGGAAAAVALGVAAVCLSKWQPRIAGATDNQTWPTGRMESQQ